MGNKIGKNIGNTLTEKMPTCSDITKLESCIEKLVQTTDILSTEMTSTRDKVHFIRCAKAIQTNIESIHRLTLSIHAVTIQNTKALEKVVSSSGWDLL